MKIAFNTANLVARVSGYRFTMDDWGAQAEATAAATTEKEWAGICAEIAGAGYRAAEVWVAHCDPRFTSEKAARKRRAIMDDHGGARRLPTCAASWLPRVCAATTRTTPRGWTASP